MGSANGNAKRGSMAGLAAARVREDILSKKLTPGTTVRPEDVGARLGISPTPAREALQTLRAEGFLVSTPGVGFVVAPLTAGDILDIFTAHAFLAGELTARAVEKATDEDIDELEAVHYELMAAERRRDLARAEERNHVFHRHITQLADAPKLAHILGIVARYVPRTFYSEVEGWDAASAEDHAAILAAFRARDTEAARRAMSEHMANAGRLLAEDFD